jgi:hypothetical protein
MKRRGGTRPWEVEEEGGRLLRVREKDVRWGVAHPSVVAVQYERFDCNHQVDLSQTDRALLAAELWL